MRRLAGLDLSTLTRRRVTHGLGDCIAEGAPAGIGVATGVIALSSETARALAAKGLHAILVRNDIATDDIDGIASADGVLTARGGRTSHAAVVARELGKVAVVGCGTLQIAPDGKSCTIAGRMFQNGALLTLDGETGRIYAGEVEITEEWPLNELSEVKAWRALADHAT